MDEAFAVVAHPQLLVALAALLLLALVMGLELLAALRAWQWAHTPQPQAPSAFVPLGPEADDWMYE